MQAGRAWYFLFSSMVVCIPLVAAVVASLFSKDLSLGAGDFEMLSEIYKECDFDSPVLIMFSMASQKRSSSLNVVKMLGVIRTPENSS